MANTSSSLLRDELFEAGDPAFVGELLRFDAEGQMKKWAEKLWTDKRPFARAALISYVLDGCDRPKHRAFVKTAFKRAEAAQDDELMGCFLYAFDRLPVRTLAKVEGWDWELRRKVERRKWQPVNGVVGRAIPKYKSWDYRSKQKSNLPLLGNPLPRFSRVTRDYLKRRAWRYFRLLAHRDGARYVAAISSTLHRYQDADLNDAAKLLSAWGLVHACFFESPVLSLPGDSADARVANGQVLSALQAAPFKPEVWNTAFESLLALMMRASARPVRNFALQILRTKHKDALSKLEPVRLATLLNHRDEDVQQFVAQMLEQSISSDAWNRFSIDDWIALFSTTNVFALNVLVKVFTKHVAPDRLSLEQATLLATSSAPAVADAGWRILSIRPMTLSEWPLLLRVIDAEVAAVREAAAKLVLERLTQAEWATNEHLRDLLDARHENVRHHALQLVRTHEILSLDTMLWQAMLESPYADVREGIIDDLAKHEAKLPEGAMLRLWATTLLSVTRGSRAKTKVLAQVTRVLAASPERAPELLRLVRFALRSVRGTERTAAIAAIASALTANETLRAVCERELPELQLTEEVA